MAFASRFIKSFTNSTRSLVAPPKRLLGNRFHSTESKGTVNEKLAVFSKDEKAVGMEKEDLEFVEHGKDVTDYDAFVRQEWGTVQAPVKVPSSYETRIVGCIGGPTPEKEHELLWHTVIKEKNTVCWECGQYFVLTPKQH